MTPFSQYNISSVLIIKICHTVVFTFVLTNVHGFSDLITDLSLILIITLIKINQNLVVYSSISNYLYNPKIIQISDNSFQ